MATYEVHECTEQELLMLDHYFDPEVNFNKTEALRRAGYSHARKQVHRVFSRERVQDEITRRRREREKRFMLNEQDLLHELGKIALQNPLDYGHIDEEGNYVIDLSGTSREEMAAVAGIESEVDVNRDPETRGVTLGSKKTKLKFLDKQQAIDKLMRHLGMFSKDAMNLHVKADFATEIMKAQRRVRGRRKTGETENE